MPTFPDYPGHRFMYDQDGTIVSVSPTSLATPLTVIDSSLLNDEDNSDAYSFGAINTSQWREVVWAFPEPRDLTGLFVAFSSSNTSGYSANMSYSTNTTDGSDGTWTSYGSVLGGLFNTGSIHNIFRSSILPITGLSSILGIKIRITSGANGSWGIYAAHLYGDISVTTNANRLEFWDSVINQKLNKMGLDFADVVAGTSVTKQFRLKNLSTTKTAHGVVISRDNDISAAVNDSMISGLQFSLDDITWATTATIGSIPPENYSVPIFVKRTVASNESAAARVARIKAIPTTFEV